MCPVNYMLATQERCTKKRLVHVNMLKKYCVPDEVSGEAVVSDAIVCSSAKR